ncbi:hypothetical protein [Clostridium tyrobutyricum]|jgi:hypothetical protein|uniref:hypothetical protein n=1 Tax=Clostridium tyrobutyricum TaxID=1519 RepID=UPI0010AAA05C|nr:hypothetical protein [Clostridium tyrobutyricum]MBR9648574.1 hypothetical protein [Clostridium tyrobutyricum]MBV4440444.1 hypothetical protein [Clostridium tyrobutyricum]QCH29437.1 hypothetical protein EZN00_03070 [Clostridium tyrobutyricum]
MKNHVFYSWQSDLPNKNNRSFIEDCIKKALKELNSSETFDIEFCIDRDTMNEAGTPDIANTIFAKIEKSKLFIADVSIINSDYGKRKTSNPNVLIELGYAAKVLGWDRIICLFNVDYGSFNDLPFDIKFRRPLCYSLTDKNKSEVKKQIAEAIKSNISSVDSKEFISIHEVGSYLVLESSEFYNLLQADVERILSDSKIQKRYGFTNDTYVIEIWDDLLYRIDNGESAEDSDIQHFISIEFTDDIFNEVRDEKCCISFQLSEKFKQINFSNYKVYSAFEIISRGYSPSEKRDYSGLSDEIIKKFSINS